MPKGETEIDIEIDPELVPALTPQFLDERLRALSDSLNRYSTASLSAAEGRRSTDETHLRRGTSFVQKN